MDVGGQLCLQQMVKSQPLKVPERLWHVSDLTVQLKKDAGLQELKQRTILCSSDQPWWGLSLMRMELSGLKKDLAPSQAQFLGLWLAGL